MTVNDLIEYLQAFASTAGNKPVIARDDNGRLSIYLELWNDEDRFIIDAWPEPDTQFYKRPFDGPGDEHPFDGPDDDRYCPGPCNGDFNE